ncbi:hypothetical protein RclHR1_02990002 [Rhizophagus clarus]|uniref:BACK domain-containing protein n=1 Tax=Rhizophagus clarus TaxID=94130 RepID=A0A2Z6RL31_9GLOM|nr:hypothetical protein RclHR1_02990002 [Rhizophagus clarus]
MINLKKKEKFINYICRFIYLQGLDVLNLLDDLDIHSLITYIQEYLIEHQTENSTGIHEIVYQHESFTNLWNSCIEKICKEPKILFDSNNFINLKTPLLELLLKQDNLNIDEIEILNGLLKWCFAQ